MPRAERGTPKYIANQLKSKGLQRLRWYCQACEKQCRDENGFKCHTQSESHIRQMQLIGENPNKHISEFSQRFKQDFLQLLRTAHGEKKVQFNQFYQEYIRDKNHIHMNATHWKTLSEFCRYLGREGICRVELTDKGYFISWIDNSSEALRRRQALAQKERLDKGEEEREKSLLKEQIEKAHADAEKKRTSSAAPNATQASTVLQREPENKFKLELKRSQNSGTNYSQDAIQEKERVNPFKLSKQTSKPRTGSAPNIFSKSKVDRGSEQRDFQKSSKPLSSLEKILNSDRGQRYPDDVDDYRAKRRHLIA